MDKLARRGERAPKRKATAIERAMLERPGELKQLLAEIPASAHWQALAQERNETVPEMLERVSIHESGHAITRILLGRPFGFATLEPSVRFVRSEKTGKPYAVIECAVYGDEASAAELVRRVAQRPDETVPQAYERYANADVKEMTVKMAGMAAEILHFGDPDDPILLAGAACDMVGLSTMSRRIGLVAATRLLRERWDAVVRVAEALGEKGRLTYDEVRELVAKDARIFSQT